MSETRVNCILSERLKFEFATCCARLEMTQSQVVRTFIEQFVGYAKANYCLVSPKVLTDLAGAAVSLIPMVDELVALENRLDEEQEETQTCNGNSKKGGQSL